MSIVTVGEFEAGILLARDPATRATRLRRLSEILGEAPVLSIDVPVASRYAELRAATGRRPSNDLWIAATALAHGFGVATRNAREFERVRGLRVIAPA